MAVSTILCSWAGPDKEYGLSLKFNRCSTEDNSRNLSLTSLRKNDQTFYETWENPSDRFERGYGLEIRPETIGFQKIESSFHPYSVKYLQVVIRVRSCNYNCLNCVIYLRHQILSRRRPEEFGPKDPCNRESIDEILSDILVPKLPRPIFGALETNTFCLPIVRKNGSGLLLKLECFDEGFRIVEVFGC